jgi:agmatinase
MIFLKTAPFLAAKEPSSATRVALFGCPYDGTSSYRPGARFGPAAIREASQVLETYEARLRCDLEERYFCDLGDVELSAGDKADALSRIGEAARKVLALRQIPAALGGEHLITLPIIEAVREHHSDLVVLQFDAHFDLRNKYLGDTLCHATVMRRVCDALNPSRILRVGARSGTLEEYEFAEKHGISCPSNGANEIRDWAGDRPIYITIDMDVLDPAFCPGTGTPEPGGLTYCELDNLLLQFQNLHIVGWDVVELAPHWDTSGISSVAAAKIVRTLLAITTVC